MSTVLASVAAAWFAASALAQSVPENVSAGDWVGIRAAYEAGRHAVAPAGCGYRARNPGQQWTTVFDDRGFVTTPDARGWNWGLQLLRYGWEAEERGGEARMLKSPASVEAAGARVAYAWDERLTEWYVNDRRGLEHGFTVQSQPQGAAGPLTLVLAVRGGLTPVVSASGRDVVFEDEAGAAVVRYAGLAVLDADGRALDAGWQVEAGGEGGEGGPQLRLQVDDRGARYPLHIDPIAQQAYLKASNTNFVDWFGFVVAIDGDTAVVGAPREASAATGVDGDQTDNSAGDAGAAYVFHRVGTTWSQQAYLKASNTGMEDEFGLAVAISGDTIVVGAWMEDSSATGVDGDQLNDDTENAGAAYVFHRVGTTWTQQAYLKASNTGTLDGFGWSVAIDEDTAVIGARDEFSAATGVGGDESDDSAPLAGAAYVFTRDGSTWSEQAYLKASNTGAGDNFGYSVAVDRETVVVGALQEDSSATGVGGDGSDNSAPQSGAVYVYLRSGAPPVWNFVAYLKASNAQAADFLGESVSISNQLIASGANSEDSSATGVGGDESSNGTLDSGAVYVWKHIPTAPFWQQEAYIKASNPGANDEFGNTVDVEGNRLVVGAHWEDSNATGVDGDQANDLATRAGAAYVFEHTGGTWSQIAYLKASNTDPIDEFGWSVAIDDETIVVGAFREDSMATGVNGDDDDDSMPNAGAAYIFQLDPFWPSQGNALAGIFGDPVLVGYGPLSAGSSNLIALSNAALSAPAGLFIAFSSTPVPFAGGTLRPFPFLLLTFGTSPSGTITLPFVMPPGAPPGTELWFQFAIVDAAAIFGKSLSNAIMSVTP